MRSAEIYVDNQLCGELRETDEGFEFAYLPDYLCREDAHAVSLSLPLADIPYRSSVLFPFFDGLIPEGWLLDVAVDNWKISERDRFGLLLACCRDCIGNVSVRPSSRPFIPSTP